jgi:hypothetical protein
MQEAIKWSSQNGPFDLVYYESYICDNDARLRERFYQTGFGKQIKYIILKNLGP